MSRSFDAHIYEQLEPEAKKHHHRPLSISKDNPADLWLEYKREFIKKHGEDAWEAQQQAYREWEENFYDHD